jgi:hypothetical protein
VSRPAHCRASQRASATPTVWRASSLGLPLPTPLRSYDPGVTGEGDGVGAILGVLAFWKAVDAINPSTVRENKEIACFLEGAISGFENAIAE